MIRQYIQIIIVSCRPNCIIHPSKLILSDLRKREKSNRNYLSLPNSEEFVDISRQNERRNRGRGGEGGRGESARSGSWTKLLKPFPHPHPRLASAGRRIMRAKQKDNSPIRGRKSGRNGSKKLLFKNVFTVWPGVQGDPGDPPLESWPFTPVFSVCASPSFPLLLLLLLAALSRDVETAGGERAPRAFAATRPPPPAPPPSPRVPARRGCVCANTRGGGRVRGRRKPRVRFSRQPFQTFSALRLRIEEGRGERREE